MRCPFEIDGHDRPIWGWRLSRTTQKIEMRAVAENCILNTTTCTQRTSNYFQIPILLLNEVTSTFLSELNSANIHRGDHLCQGTLSRTRLSIIPQEFWCDLVSLSRALGYDILWVQTHAWIHCTVEMVSVEWSYFLLPCVDPGVWMTPSMHPQWGKNFDLFFRKLWISTNPTTSYSLASWTHELCKTPMGF